MSSIYDWSLNAASNANADDNINWAEGQPPSSVNNSARAMMQRVREFVTDIGGDVSATGSANAVNITAASPIVAYSGGLMIRFQAFERNTGTMTVNLNRLGAKPVFKTSYTGVVQLTGGEIQGEGIYELIYSHKLNGGTGGWLLSAPTQPRGLPVGMIAPFAMAAAPAGWMVCNGAEILRTQYAELFTIIGTTYGAGNNVTTFNLPDYRGMFLRGWDSGRGLDQGRGFATQQGSENKSHNHDGTTSWGGDHAHEFVYPYAEQDTGSGGFTLGNVWGTQSRWVNSSGGHNHTFATNPSGGNESRPVNMAVIYAIKV